MSQEKEAYKAEKQAHLPWRERSYWRLRRWLTPGLRNAQYAYFSVLDETLQDGDRWLELGCGRRIAPAWLRHASRIEQALLARAGEVVGVDPDAQALADNLLPMTHHLGTAEHVPEPDACFDLITANMVVEHLEQPQEVLREASRLLRPGGRILFHTPNRWYPVTAMAAMVPDMLRNRLTAWLEKRDLKDIYPTRYRMNSVASIRYSAKFAGLEVESIIQTADSPESLRLGPLVAPELILIAMTRSRMLQRMQSNMIVTLRKPLENKDTLLNLTSRPLTTKEFDRQRESEHCGAAA
ncbi:MAG: class I SAM-dependent methyltransferase [Phycisphaerales bacterium JB063]